MLISTYHFSNLLVPIFSWYCCKAHGLRKIYLLLDPAFPHRQPQQLTHWYIERAPHFWRLTISIIVQSYGQNSPSASILPTSTIHPHNLQNIISSFHVLYVYYYDIDLLSTKLTLCLVTVTDRNHRLRMMSHVKYGSCCSVDTCHQYFTAYRISKHLVNGTSPLTAVSITTPQEHLY